MNKIQSSVVPSVLALGVMALAGCGEDPQAGGSGGSSGGDGGGSYAAVIKGLDNPFFQQMEQGIDAAASDSGLEVEVQAAASITDTSGQADKLNAMAQQGYDCFVVNPISGTNLVQGLAQIAAQDTPVVNIDSPIDARRGREGEPRRRDLHRHRQRRSRQARRGGHGRSPGRQRQGGPDRRHLR